MRAIEASKGMGDDEATFNVPVPLGQKVSTTRYFSGYARILTTLINTLDWISCAFDMSFSLSYSRIPTFKYHA